MTPLSSHKNIVIGLAVVIIAAVVYLIVWGGGSPTPDLTASAGGSAAELYFVNLASELDGISFDTSVLRDPRFVALIDIRTAILPEDSGRPDPFAPIPGVKTSSK